MFSCLNEWRGVTGIYKITCMVNKKIYIGSSTDISRRFDSHYSDLNRKVHHSSKLQRAYNKHGKENFKFEKLESCLIDQLLIREQYYLDTLLFAQEFIRNENRKFERLGYNILPIAGRTFKRKMSKKTRLKISLSKIGEKHHLYGKSHSAETRLKMAKSRYGKAISEESKLKISKRHKGRIHTEQSRLNMSNGRKGVASWTKGVSCLNTITNELRYFKSVKEASSYLGCRGTQISRAIKDNKMYKNNILNYVQTKIA